MEEILKQVGFHGDVLYLLLSLLLLTRLEFIYLLGLYLEITHLLDLGLKDSLGLVDQVGRV
jgi:hypothetical protein